ncbi:M23 family metallopeptidase [Candidatus Fermentibacteria bacterium]|nr:M23 family metallopeptidase [Candidatus Fermentibacteria bacterium]
MTSCAAALLVCVSLAAHTDSFSTRHGMVRVEVNAGGFCRMAFTTRAGDTLHTLTRSAFRSPQVSPDRLLFAFLAGDRLEVLDGQGRPVAAYAAGSPYAVSSGAVAIAQGSAIRIQAGGVQRSTVLPRPVVGMTWTPEGLLAATSAEAYLVDGNGRASVLRIEPGERITWCGGDAHAARCIIRGCSRVNDWVVWAQWDGTAMRRDSMRAVSPVPRKVRSRGFPSPFLPDTLPPIGNSYGEYQKYGVTPYRHPGVDLLGSHYEPVYAVAPGAVKAVLTTSGSYHWRVAIGDSAGPAPSEGWLYAHLDLPSIAVSVGDTVAQGDYLGALIPWPVADFTHLHFARIADQGTTWNGQWLCTGNPLLLATEIQETDPPFFDEANGALLAFCDDNTSTYLAPDSLAGLVDIIAHVGDRIKSSWVVCAQEIRYHIYPQDAPSFPVVDDRLAVYFDGEIDVYQGGAFDELIVPVLWKHDTVCPTAGDYDDRRFYHILTNSNGTGIPEPSDDANSFNTALLPDGQYVVRVTARDASGNAAVDSMTVTLANGNPPLELCCEKTGHDLLLSWRRMNGAARYLVYQIPMPYAVEPGRLLAAVADTCFLVREPFLNTTQGYYRVLATDARSQPGETDPCATPALEGP